MIRLLQLTDTHLYASDSGTLLGLNTMNSFKQVWERALEGNKDLDAILLTGDLSQDYHPKSYERLREMCKNSPCPIYTIPGNHDEKPLLESLLHDAPFTREQVIDYDYWRVILLDSAVKDKVEGLLEDSQLRFLEEKLHTAGNKSILLCLHHHPVDVHCEWIDRIGLKNREAFWNIIDKYPNVKVVIWGHVHQAFDGTHGHVHCLSTPSTCIQFKPQTKTFELDTQSPGYRLLKLHDDGQFETGIYRISDGEFSFDATAKGY